MQIIDPTLKKVETNNICLFCGNSKGKIEIQIPKDVSPERYISNDGVLIDHEPCQECYDAWQEGVPVMQVSFAPSSPNQPEMVKGQSIYYDGIVILMDLEGAIDFFDRDDIKLGLCVFTDAATMQELLSIGKYNDKE